MLGTCANLGMILFQNPSIPVPATPYIGASLTPLLSHRSVPSCSTSPSHSLTAYTRFAVPA
jgi:hypothetical protein